MAHYIDKDALVTEIENLENTYKECPTRNSYEEGLKDGRLLGYKDVSHKINTLEVKEVDLQEEPASEDLEEEIQNYMTLHNLHIKDGGRIVFENGDSPNFMCDMLDIARHFANWQKQQMISEAIDGTAYPDDQEMWCDLDRFNLTEGDKVKLIIIEES